MKRPNCKAYCVSDQMICPWCHLTWDMNEEIPPQCKPSALTPRPKSIPYSAIGPTRYASGLPDRNPKR